MFPDVLNQTLFLEKPWNVINLPFLCCFCEKNIQVLFVEAEERKGDRKE